MARRIPLLAAAVAALVGAAPAGAAVPAAPMQLPSPAAAQASGARGWLVGAPPTTASRRIAARFGARQPAPGIGVFLVPRAAARGLASALDAAGLLSFAEPDVRAARIRAAGSAGARAAATSSPSWRARIVAAGLQPPPVSSQKRPLVLVDTLADLSLPGWANGRATTLGSGAITSEHGTATLSVAAAPDNGGVMRGVWPGMKAVNIPTSLTCSDIVTRLGQAIALRPAAINMSYGASDYCYSEYIALQRAVRRGITPVAAAGNEFFDGNPAEYPASLPHVITVGALDSHNRSSYFSNENAAVDLAAPGEGILAMVPLSFDTADGKKDGLAKLDGTSFAAPMVAAAITWVRAARPNLKSGQVAQIVRTSARDLGRKGWDSSTGFGLLDIQAALALDAPPSDPGEPNDDIQFVDGRLFGKRAPAIAGAHGVKRTKFTAMVDRYEDPHDVYPLYIPAHGRLDVALGPIWGDPDVDLVSAKATRVGTKRWRLASSHTVGVRKSERIRYTNRSSRPLKVYIDVFIPSSVHTLDSEYVLAATVR